MPDVTVNTTTADAEALAAKAPTESPTFTGTVSGVTKSHVGLGSVDNIPATQLRDRATHTGTQAQSTVTNLTTDLAAKAPTASPTFTGTVSGVTKGHVGLGNVDNTSDANKPVSTAAATALGLKADAASLAEVALSGEAADVVGLALVGETGQYADLLGRPERLEQTVPYSNGAYPVTDPLALYHYFKGPVAPAVGLGAAREGDLWLKTTAAFPTPVGN